MPAIAKFDPKAIPSKACRFDAQVTVGQSANDASAVPVTLTARSGKVVDNWFWGRIVHDFAGMTVRDKIPLDYRHDDGQPVGYADKFDTSTGNLVVRGFLTPNPDDPRDPTQGIITKARAGVPYQASIYFDEPLELEELEPGETAIVNGLSVAGPAVIVRQWTLRGVAVCLYGVDPNTETALKMGHGHKGQTCFVKCQMRAKSKSNAERSAAIRKFKLQGYSDSMARFAASIKMPGSSPRK